MHHTDELDREELDRINDLHHTDAERELADLIRGRGLEFEIQRLPREDSGGPLNRSEMARFTFSLRRSGSLAASIESAPYSAGVGLAGSWALDLISDGKRVPGTFNHRSAVVRDAARKLHFGGPVSSGGLTIDELRAARAILAAYRPSCTDVVQSLLMDASTIEAVEQPGADWMDWAEEYGMLDGQQTAAELREIRNSYEQACANTRALRVLFGGDYARAVALAEMC